MDKKNRYIKPKAADQQLLFGHPLSISSLSFESLPRHGLFALSTRTAHLEIISSSSLLLLLLLLLLPLIMLLLLLRRTQDIIFPEKTLTPKFP